MAWTAYIGLLDRSGSAEVITLYEGKPSQVVPKLRSYGSAGAVRGLLALGGIDKLGKTPEQSKPAAGTPGSHRPFKFSVGDAQNAGRVHNADYIYLFDESDGRWKMIDLNKAGADMHPVASRIARRRIAARWLSSLRA